MQLKVIGGNAVGTEIDVDDELTIGRSAPDDAGTLGDDPELSRRHARVAKQGEGFVIEDLGSMNGTMLNGTLISGTVHLSQGDTIEVGGTRLVVELGAAQPPAPGIIPDAGQLGATRVTPVPPAAPMPPPPGTPPPPAGGPPPPPPPPGVAPPGMPTPPPSGVPAEFPPPPGTPPPPAAGPQSPAAGPQSPADGPQSPAAPPPPPLPPEPTAEPEQPVDSDTFAPPPGATPAASETVEPPAAPPTGPSTGGPLTPADDDEPGTVVPPPDEAAPSLGRVSLRVEIDVDAGEATIALEEGADGVRLVQRDGAWKLEPAD